MKEEALKIADILLDIEPYERDDEILLAKAHNVIRKLVAELERVEDIRNDYAEREAKFSKPITEKQHNLLMSALEKSSQKVNTAPRELSDEEINKLWAESHEDGIAMQQGFSTQQHYFAHLILKKASEK